MANEVKWKAPESRTSGISAASVTAGANKLGSEINNEVNLDRQAALELAWTCSTASTANRVWLVYILYDVTSAAYEDGGDSVDAFKAPVGSFADDGGTAAQKQTLTGIPLKPFAFKVLLRSELDQNATSVTLLVETYNEDIQ